MHLCVQAAALRRGMQQFVQRVRGAVAWRRLALQQQLEAEAAERGEAEAERLAEEARVLEMEREKKSGGGGKGKGKAAANKAAAAAAAAQAADAAQAHAASLFNRPKYVHVLPPASVTSVDPGPAVRRRRLEMVGCPRPGEGRSLPFAVAPFFDASGLVLYADYADPDAWETGGCASNMVWLLDTDRRAEAVAAALELSERRVAHAVRACECACVSAMTGCLSSVMLRACA